MCAKAVQNRIDVGSSPGDRAVYPFRRKKQRAANGMFFTKRQYRRLQIMERRQRNELVKRRYDEITINQILPLSAHLGPMQSPMAGDNA